MAKAYSSRKRRTRRARIDSPESKSEVTASVPADPPDLAEILGRFSDGLALIETACSALENSLEDETPISPGLVTLQRGIDELLSVYTEFDVAISKLRS